MRPTVLAGRRGYALLTVLWAMSGVAVLVLALSLAARDATGAAQNRVNATRAAWRAEGCVERARAAIDEALRGADADAAWRELDARVAMSSFVRDCELVLVPAGIGLDVNNGGSERLHLLFTTLGMSVTASDSLVAAVLDWQDPDSLVRPNGAESDWYLERHRTGPRNGPFGTTTEIALVRGGADVPGLDTVLSVEPARLLLARAPAPVLASLPGFGEEAITRTLELRTLDRSFTLDLLAASLSPPARAELMRHYAELSTLVTVLPDTWLVSSRAYAGSPSIGVVHDVWIARAGSRAAVLQRRVTPWS